VGTYSGIALLWQSGLSESATGSVFFLTDNCNGTAIIRAYNQTSFAATGTLTIPNVKGNIRSFIRWGTNGFAFRTTSTSQGQGNQLFLVQSSLVPAALPTPTPTPTPSTPTIQFSGTNYAMGEGSGQVQITVTRTGDSTGAATVDYRTTDSDTFAVDAPEIVTTRLTHAVTLQQWWHVKLCRRGTANSFNIPIIDDSFVEGSETSASR
jgi:hypothetical protein